MNDKITVEFSRKELRRICKKYRNDVIGTCHSCQKTDSDLVRCMLIFFIDFDIKEKK